MQSHNLQSVGLALVSLIAGVLIGAVGGQMFNISDETVTKTTDEAPNAQTPATDFRTQINLVMSQHVETTYDALVSGYEEDAASQLATERAERVNEDVIATLGVVYGDEELNEFNEAWSDYTTSLQNYAAATADQSASDVVDAEDSIDEAASSIGLAIEDLTQENMDEAMVEERFGDYTRDLIRAFDAATAGNFDESYTHLDDANRQLVNLADDLSEAVITARQDQF